MQWTEEQMDRTIGTLLRTGVGLAATWRLFRRKDVLV